MVNITAIPTLGGLALNFGNGTTRNIPAAAVTTIDTLPDGGDYILGGTATQFLRIKLNNGEEILLPYTQVQTPASANIAALVTTLLSYL
jgi:hypothetical protein